MTRTTQPRPCAPHHPFIDPDDPEGTQLAICAVLALKDYRFLQYESFEKSGGAMNSDHLDGEVRILLGVDSAVRYLADLAIERRSAIREVKQ